MNTWKKAAALLLTLTLALCLTSCDVVQSAIGSATGKQDPSVAGNKPAGDHSQEDPSVAGNIPAGDHSGDTDPSPGQGGQDTTAPASWTLNNGVLTISGSGDMTKVTNFNSIDSSNKWPWYDQRNSITSIVIENGITNIGNFAFSECENLSSITIADSVTTIGRNAFVLCNSLTNITIPDSITGNLDATFANCHNLKTATVGTNVEMVDSTFYNCPSLESITFLSSNTDTAQGYLPLYCADPATHKAQKENIIIYAPTGSPIEAACKAQGYNFSPLN